MAKIKSIKEITVLTIKGCSDNYRVRVAAKDFIEVQREGHVPVEFKIGDIAAYDSYNLRYTGIIRSITEKTVTIEAYPNTQSSRNHRLKLLEFCCRNYDFNAQRVANDNSNAQRVANDNSNSLFVYLRRNYGN